jgi:hypothetical protein
MQSLRRFRKLIVLAALVWLPMTVFAQICATSAQAGLLAGLLQLSMVVAVDATQPAAITTPPTSADVDDTACDCDMKAVCAFAALSVLAPDAAATTVIEPVMFVPLAGITAFSTRLPVPDTPPPRHFLLT